ncbi:hypothetical protein FSP39_005404 [Pinctada imbricata]|nr:hypothetical protein FSP39_005404 [Pinctada imbricata]
MDTEDFLSDVMCVGESKVSNNDMLKEEISRYINVEMEGNFTVLQWWKQNELYFPRLSRVARRFLCVQASSVPSERVFSVAGSLVSKKRSRLTPENVDKFIFLNKNMKGFW